MKTSKKSKFSTFWKFEINLLNILEQKFSMTPTKQNFEAKISDENPIFGFFQKHKSQF